MNVIHCLKGLAGCVTTCALAVGIAVAANAQTVLIDFGNDASFRGATIPNPDANGNYWTSMRTGVFYQNLVDIQNVPTTIDFGFSTGVATDSYNGPAGPTEPIPGIPASSDPHFFIPFTDVDQTALGKLGGDLAGPFDYVAGPGVPGHNQVRFEIQELDPAKKYNLTFFASHKYSTDTTTVFSVYSDNTYTTQVGTANLNVQSGADPSLHNRDTVATISNLSPQASNILYVQFIGSLGGPGYLNDMQITATTPVINGDYNSDGKVDAADYAVWRKYAGTTHVLPNDPTGGTIGSAQYTTWRSNFGTGGPGAGSGLGSGSAVPEPTMFVLAFVGAVSMISLRRR
jgi:hypothetical protein